MGDIPRTLGEIALWDSVIDVDTPIKEIEAIVLNRIDLPGFVVTKGSKIVGLLSRKQFVAILSRQFAREVLSKGKA